MTTVTDLLDGVDYHDDWFDSPDYWMPGDGYDVDRVTLWEGRDDDCYDYGT